MSYRDDHDAAVSRIDALERELAHERDESRIQSERDRTRIAMLERELAELQRHEPRPRPRARTVPPAPKPPPVVPVVDELDHRGPPISRWLLGALALLTAGAIALAAFMLRSEPSHAPATTCTVDTVPQHAKIIVVTPRGEIVLGMTPVELPFDEWARYSKLHLKLEGYDTLTIAPPSQTEGCSRDAYDLPAR